jgi:hypothetical protein
VVAVLVVEVVVAVLAAAALAEALEAEASVEVVPVVAGKPILNPSQREGLLVIHNKSSIVHFFCDKRTNQKSHGLQ